MNDFVEATGMGDFQEVGDEIHCHLEGAKPFPDTLLSLWGESNHLLRSKRPWVKCYQQHERYLLVVSFHPPVLSRVKTL